MDTWHKILFSDCRDMHEIARADDRTMRARREISHPPEVHDDIVYALALALYMMRKELKGGVHPHLWKRTAYLMDVHSTLFTSSKVLWTLFFLLPHQLHPTLLWSILKAQRNRPVVEVVMHSLVVQVYQLKNLFLLLLS